MQTADFDHNHFTGSGASEADKSLLVKFFLKPRQNKAATAKEGRPIFNDVEYVDIKLAGNRGAGACRPATDGDKQRFPEHYAKFKQRLDTELDEGTPLLEWAPCSRSLAEELAFFHVKTVEQLVNMADTQVSKFMGLTALKEKARLWLESAEKEKPMWEMDQRIKELRVENDELRQSVQSLIQELKGDSEELTTAQKKRKKARAIKAAETKSE
jgi:hypothetical protein